MRRMACGGCPPLVVTNDPESAIRAACCRPLRRWSRRQPIFIEILIGNIVFRDFGGVHFPSILIVGFLHTCHSAGVEHLSLFYQLIDAFRVSLATATNIVGLPIDEPKLRVLCGGLPSLGAAYGRFLPAGRSCVLRSMSNTIVQLFQSKASVLMCHPSDSETAQQRHANLKLTVLAAARAVASGFRFQG